MEKILDLDRKLEVVKATFDIMHDINEKRTAELDIIIQGWKEVLAILSSVGKQKIVEPFLF